MKSKKEVEWFIVFLFLICLGYYCLQITVPLSIYWHKSSTAVPVINIYSTIIGVSSAISVLLIWIVTTFLLHNFAIIFGVRVESNFRHLLRKTGLGLFFFVIAFYVNKKELDHLLHSGLDNLNSYLISSSAETLRLRSNIATALFFVWSGFYLKYFYQLSFSKAVYTSLSTIIFWISLYCFKYFFWFIFLDLRHEWENG